MRRCALFALQFQAPAADECLNAGGLDRLQRKFHVAARAVGVKDHQTLRRYDQPALLKAVLTGHIRGHLDQDFFLAALARFDFGLDRVWQIFPERKWTWSSP